MSFFVTLTVSAVRSVFDAIIIGSSLPV